MTYATAIAPPRTLLDALMAAFEDALRTPEGVVQPAAILWPDPDSQWAPVVARLRASFPRVYSLGQYDLAARTGPAIWLRCVVARTLPEVSPAPGTVPVLYLPGVSRQTLRAAEDCPPALLPLVELQYRGKVWYHPNTREWTVEGFLTAEQGLKLDIARDGATREAALNALPLLADADLSSLRGRRLDAGAFNKLAVDDPVRDLLRWINDPDGTRAALGGARWPALRSMIRDEFDFDPQDDHPSEAASRLALGGGAWDQIWQRFCENPRLYPGIPRLLRDPAVTAGELALDMSRRPAENDEQEARLRKDLESAGHLPRHEACLRVISLEKEHASRRSWVWAEIGESPLAQALEPLARLATCAQKQLAGSSVVELIDHYTEAGWHCDAAAMAALGATLKTSDQAVVHAVVRALYLSWLDDGARRLQELATADSADFVKLVNSPTPERDCCILFVDGLRYDVGAGLHELLMGRGLESHLEHRVAPLPTVTPTAKPAATPIADQVGGPNSTDDFCAVLTADQKPITAQRLRDTMAAQGIEVMAADECRVPVGSKGGWTEGGQLDELGHKLQVRLASELPREVERLADRITALLDAGWKRVRVVTDHGWLLMPGGLPKVDLPKFLTETKWSRCAVVKGESTTTMPVWPWHWNPSVRIATPHGVACFWAGNEYAHGGVSLQELVTPMLTVGRGTPEVKPKITEVSWARLRCRVVVENPLPGQLVDMRSNWKDPDSSVAGGTKPLDHDGQASLFVRDAEKEGAAAAIVILDAAGRVIDRKTTTVGEA